ncbi:hypothetical protein [Azospirillum sp. B2RO_4]
MSKHSEATDRHHGGPGSSRQNADKPAAANATSTTRTTRRRSGRG